MDLLVFIPTAVAAVSIGVAIRAVRQLKSLMSEPVALPPIKPAERPQFARVAGTTIDMRDWSPELIDKIRETYFRPSITGKFVQVVDVAATCPREHVTRDRVVFVARDLQMAKDLSAAMLRSEIGRQCPNPKCKTVIKAAAKVDVRCTECGKQAHVTGRSIVWEGPAAEWDGSV